MFCHQCGAKLPEDASFCDQCGALVREEQPAGSEPENSVQSARGSLGGEVLAGKSPDQQKRPEPGEPTTEAPFPGKGSQRRSAAETARTASPPDDEPAASDPKGSDTTQGSLLRDDNGGYTWIYEYSLWKNPTVLITLGKVLLLSAVLVALFIFFITLGEGASEAFMAAAKVLGITGGIMAVLLLIAYPVYSIVNGGKYIVVFEMDDRGIVHRQLQQQYHKNQVLGMLTAAAGLASGSPTIAGAGLLSATKSTQKSTFRNVRKIVIRADRHVIYLNDANGFNQVYAESEQFPFIRDFIVSRCPKAAVSEK